MIEPKTGEYFKYGGRKQKRPPGSPTPCGQCPKKGPENEGKLTLSDHNKWCLVAFLQCLATGTPEAWRLDDTLRWNFGIISRIYTQWQATQNNDNLSLTLSEMIRGGVR